MRVYFMGIGGTGMGNVALLAHQMGDTVMGSDGPLYPPMSTELKDLEVFVGYDAARLKKLIEDKKVDAVVIGNSISRGNPELEWFWNTKPCAYYSMPQFMHERVLKNRRTIGVCGTHGKTTTTTLTAYLLEHNNAQPGWMIGGVPQDLPSGGHPGSAGGPFVIEGDEYDTAFFDKRAKFISYQPTVAVINNIEPDHLDIYRDIDDLKRAFNYLIRTIPANGLIIANRDDANVRSLLPVSWAPVLWVSAEGDPAAELQIKNYTENASGSEFDLVFKGEFWHHVTWKLGGLFNARNAAMAALAAGCTLSPMLPTALNLHSLESFVGVKRRQEVRFNSKKLVVVEDFAHHPTAVALTLHSLKLRFPGRRWVACLEPRSATSRTNAHQLTFPLALANADVSILAPVHNAERLAPEKRLDTERLARDIQALGKEVCLTKSCAEIPALLEEIVIENNADKLSTGVVFFSNGSFEGAMQRYLDSLETSATRSATVV